MPRRGDALPVRVDTVEVLHLRHLIVGTNTSPRDQTSLIAGIDERLHQHSASTISASSTNEGTFVIAPSIIRCLYFSHMILVMR